MRLETPSPGAVLEVRGARWKVISVRKAATGFRVIRCRGLAGIARDKHAEFVLELEHDARILDPASVTLIPDRSPGLTDTKLFLASAFRSSPTTTRTPLTLGRAAIDDLKFQHLPVNMALQQDRVRLLIADDVGLGKTLEAGLITAELMLRGRANRILVVTTRAMLSQFQKEFWTRFTIPLARLDSAAIRRMRNNIPAHYNVFDQFDRSIVSIDTLKKDGQIRAALEGSFWDLIIIDEAHNAADRSKSSGKSALRTKLAQLLARRSDALLLLTATPHDGSQESFASLVQMLDPTRVPNVNALKRQDINDLVVRRFRSSPEVIADLRQGTLERKLHARRFPLSAPEEAAYDAIAELKLELDEESRGRAIDLFRTTLAKAIFSSPAACLETLEGRIQRMERGTARGTLADLASLKSLADKVRAIDTPDFTKYQFLKNLLGELRWTGRAPRDRLVIFSERIRTLEWLQQRLTEDFALTPEQIGRVDGGSVEADEKTQLTLEQFGQERAPIRILLASDMASEGLNLHFQCHRLIHFDLPWSLLRFQQRNGRIDRYGQDRNPDIYYFVGETTHPKVRQMWVLEKLVEKDEAAQSGVGDPAVFFGAGNVEGEEAQVAEVVASGGGEQALEQIIQNNVQAAAEHHAAEDSLDALFGEYTGISAISEGPASDPENRPPTLYKDAFAYAAQMLERLAVPELGIFPKPPTNDMASRQIRFRLAEDMYANDSLGYARTRTVDDRLMPAEALAPGGVVELTDDPQIINRAIDQAKSEERAWPQQQYLWEGHPLMNWFADHAERFFGDHSAPIARLTEGIAPEEVVVIIHGAIPNQNGAPVVDRWAAVRLSPSGEAMLEAVDDFLTRTRLREDTPNTRPEIDIDASLQSAVARAVSAFQDALVRERTTRKQEIEQDLDAVLERLCGLEDQFTEQLSLRFEGIAERPEDSLSGLERARLAQFNLQKYRVNQLFEDWSEWYRRTRSMVEDSNPYVDIKAVFVS